MSLKAEMTSVYLAQMMCKQATLPLKISGTQGQQVTVRAEEPVPEQSEHIQINSTDLY